MSIKSLIRTIPDHPKPGILFRDITTLLQDPKGLRLAVDGIVEKITGEHFDKVVGIEARGFILGGALAMEMGAGFVPVRKPGKLPGQTIGEDYELEYGTDRLEMHMDSVAAGDRVLVVDDLIATGGTALAAVRLIRRQGAEVGACAFIVDLPDLGGADRIRGQDLRLISLCEFEGE